MLILKSFRFFSVSLESSDILVTFVHQGQLCCKGMCLKSLSERPFHLIQNQKVMTSACAHKRSELLLLICRGLREAVSQGKKGTMRVRVLYTLMCMRAQSFRRVQLFVTPQTAAHQASLSLGFSWQEYWTRLPFPSPGSRCFLQLCNSTRGSVSDLLTRKLFAVVQSLSRVQLFATPWTAAYYASLSLSISWSLLKLMSVESMMPSNYLILCRPLLLLLSIFPSLRVFSAKAGMFESRRESSFLLQCSSGLHHRRSLTSPLGQRRNASQCSAVFRDRQRRVDLEPKGDRLTDG